MVGRRRIYRRSSSFSGNILCCSRGFEVSKDSDYIAKLEKAIAEKYGTETIQNPKGNWDKEKEEEYIQQLKKLETLLQKKQLP